MRTIRCSGRLGGEGAVHPQADTPPAQFMLDTPPAQSNARVHPPRGQDDRRLWKHYLSATTVADGNNIIPGLKRPFGVQTVSSMIHKTLVIS